MRWDSRWYSRIATDGYHWQSPLPGHSDRWISDLAFFPGLPLVARVLHRCGIAPGWATLLASWLGFILAAVVITLVGYQLGGMRTGVLLILLWGVAPRAVVQVLGYSEGWFIAAIGAGLLMALRRNWIRAGLAICIAGVFRPSVVPAGVLLGLAWMASWPVLGLAVTPGERRRRLLGAALTPWGILGYAAVVACRTDRWNGYLLVQRAWGSTLGWSTEVFRTAAQRWPTAPFNWTYFGLVAASVILYTVLLMWMIATRQPPLLSGYVALVLLLTVSSQGYFQSKARFMLPAFPAFLPLAQALGRTPLWAQISVMVVLSGLSTWWSVSVLSGVYSP